MTLAYEVQLLAARPLGDIIYRSRASGQRSTAPAGTAQVWPTSPEFMRLRNDVILVTNLYFSLCDVITRSHAAFMHARHCSNDKESKNPRDMIILMTPKP